MKHSSPENEPDELLKAAMDDMRDPEVASALRAEQAQQPASPENELADRLYNYVKKYNGDWATASPALSWDDMDTIIGALRRPAHNSQQGE